ncbi:MAG: hypothetical protein AAFQ92_02965 [Bacteroidota bacterium]
MTKISLYIRLFSLCLLLLCLCTLEAYSQTSRPMLDADNGLFGRLTGIRIGLWAENGLHPGLRVGTSYILSEKEKNRSALFKALRKRRVSQQKIVQYLADGNVGFYTHPNNHVGAYGGIGLSRMQTNATKLRTLGLSIELNYLRRTYNIPTLELNGDGTLNEIGGAGTNSFVLALAPSFGKLFGGGQGKREKHIYIKPQVQLIGYDFGLFPNAAIELGIAFGSK